MKNPQKALIVEPNGVMRKVLVDTFVGMKKEAGINFAGVRQGKAVHLPNFVRYNIVNYLGVEDVANVDVVFDDDVPMGTKISAIAQFKLQNGRRQPVVGTIVVMANMDLLKYE